MIDIQDASVSDITTSRLTDREVWATLVEAFDAVIIANVDDPIKQLESIRFLSPGADPKTFVDVCRMLGFDLSQDILNMSQDKFTKLASQLGMYPDTNGTEDFTKFISLMTNGNCTVEYLWTKDYVNFYNEPLGQLLVDGGTWFKTTHIDLNMGFSTLDGLQLKDGQTLGQRIVDIFYQQAPAALVIKKQTFTVTMSTDDIGIGTQIDQFQRIYTLAAAGGRSL
jgi:hypothetical protein